MADPVVLIRPPSVMRGTSFIAQQYPLNLASIAAVLLQHQYSVEIWDFDAEIFEVDAFVKRIRDVNPGIVGISCYTPTIENGHLIASLVKQHLPESLVVVGGPHVSALPERTLLEFDKFDVGVIGEGELTFHDLVAAVAGGLDYRKVKGLVYRSDEKMVRTEARELIRDLDILPFPARHLLKHSLYRGQSHRGFSRNFLKISEIMTSRGCPNRCIFCASDVTLGQSVRFRSAASVSREIDECVQQFGYNHFVVSDDTFTLREDRLMEICDSFRRNKVTWNCNARVHPISRAMLDRMVESGCVGITFGVESGSPRILKLIKKNATVRQIEQAFRLARESGVNLIEADVIIGSHPSETASDIELTVSLLKRIAPDILMASVVVPYPGTELYSIMRDAGLIFDSGKWDSFSLFGKEPSWRTENFGPLELIGIQRRMMARFYYNPLYILRIVKKIRSFDELKYWMAGGFEFMKVCARPLLGRFGSG
jgi:radical SAM superfamily enzyme YgiQ (UPF0313 family)